MQTQRVRLYWDTVRHLKPIQVWRRVWRPLPRVRGVQASRREPQERWVDSVQREDAWLGGRRWKLLNQEREISTWNDPGIEKLWLYHLHYLERPHPETVTAWIEENPAGNGNGWEPYPISRRITSWVKWLLESPLEETLRRQVENSLAAQAEWLSQSLEWHLLGNHLLANAKGLVLAGAYFDGPDAWRWLQEGIGILRRELKEQILEDGGHFELSPMYHALLLEDLLDLVNISHLFPQALGEEETEWRRLAARMLGWLSQMTHPNGQTAYFNDSVHGMAADHVELESYAARLGVKAEHVPLGPSGYIRLEAGDTVVLFDAGPVGPDYQPGHAHCDLLSLEVSYNGQPVITNTGISTYESCPTRLEERRTAAHNTVRVDGAEQSEVWESFRVARRARVLHTKVSRCWAEAKHDGYRRLTGGVTHWRRVEVDNEQLKVDDRLEGTGFHRVEIFWHLAPGANVNVQFGDNIVRLDKTGAWCIEFGRRIERPVVVGLWEGYLPVQLETCLFFN